MNYIIKKKNGELYHGGPWSPEKLKYGISTANIQAYRKRLAEIYGQAKGAVGSAYRTAKPYAQTAYSTARKVAGSAYRTAKPYAKTAYNSARSAAGSAYGQAKGAVNGFVNKKRAQKNAEKYQRDGKLRTYNMMDGGKFKVYKNDPKTAEYAVNRIRAQRKDQKEQGEAYRRDQDKKKMEARVSAANAQARGKKLTEKIGSIDHYNFLNDKKKRSTNRHAVEKYQRDGKKLTNRINGTSSADKYQRDGMNRTGLEKSKMTANGPKRKPGLRKDLSKVRNQDLRRDILNGNKTSGNSTASEFYGKQRGKLNVNANGHRTKKIIGIKNQKLRKELLDSRRPQSSNSTASEFYGKKAHKLNLKSTGSHRTKKIAGIKNQKLRDELLRSKKKKSGNRTAF